MAKLSDLIKQENWFKSIDGRILKTVVDLKGCLSACSEKDFSDNLNFFRTNLISWVQNVLVLKELADDLVACDTLAQATDIMNKFLEEFDYHSSKLSDDKAFHTREYFDLKSLHELYYYINNCNEDDFIYYVNNQKNDFANWVNDVLLCPNLAIKLRKTFTHVDMILLLKQFLLNDPVYGDNSEYTKYIGDRLNTIIKPKKLSESEKAFVEYSKETPIDASTVVSKDLSISTPTLKLAKEKVEETIDLSNGPNLERKEEVEKVAPKEFDMSGFRQFTDEELEKFVAFSKHEVAIDPNPKIEYLKNTLQELNNMIRDLRRLEKDPLVADLMLRTVGAKIDYYALSNNVDDYNHIIRIFKDVQHEIEECANQQSYNLADEIFNNLKFQAIALKRA